MKLVKQYWPALFLTAFLLLCGIAGSIYDILYNGATAESRYRLALEHLKEEEVQFVEERSIVDGGFILWLYEQNGQKGVATFTQSEDNAYYFSGYRLNDGGEPSSINLYNMDHGSYEVLLFDHPNLTYLEYEIYADEKLWKSEKITAEQLMVIEMPQSNSVQAKFTYYDTEGKQY